jgi:GTP pyrophosphokinase
MANEAHNGQSRRSGEPYIIHPLNVSEILVNLGMDTDSIVAALLHDVVEDTDIPLETIKKKFGNDVALLVDGVTKLGKIPLSTPRGTAGRERAQDAPCHGAGCARHHHQACRRLHNLRTLSFMPDENAGKKRWKPWKSTRHSHTVWELPQLKRSSRISRCNISTQLPTTKSSA